MSHFQGFFKGSVVTSKKPRKKSRELHFSIESLRWILKILLQLKCSSPCSGLKASNGSLWWPPVVMGNGGEGLRVFGRE